MQLDDRGEEVRKVGIDPFIKHMVEGAVSKTEFFRIMGDDRFDHFIDDRDFTHPSLTLIVVKRIHKESSLAPKSLRKSPVVKIEALEAGQGDSSTEARAKLKSDEIPQNIHPGVLQYIQEKGLYQSQKNIDRANAIPIKIAA